MGGDTRLLLGVADAIGIDDEIALLQALGTLGKNWKTLAGDVDGAGSALDLLTAIAKGAQGEAVAAAFGRIGAEDQLATLQGAGERLGRLTDQVQSPLAVLLEPIGRFDETRNGADHGLVRWSLAKSIGTASDGPEDAPSYALSLDADAALTIEAGARWPYSDIVPGPLLRLRAEGSLKPKASATLPFTGGSATASASASAACALEYFFAVPDVDTVYAAAVADRLGQLVDPFDFDAVWRGFSDGGLMGLHYGFDGSVGVNVSVSLADAGALAQGIKAQIGATVAMSFALEGRFFLTFRAAPRGGDGLPRIEAVLSRGQTQRSGASLAIGGSIDVSTLATRVHAILAGALGEWDAVLQEITPYLAPGTWLRSNAGGVIDALAADLVKDAALAKALAQDLTGVIAAGEPDESQLAAWLGERLAGGLDAAQDWAGDQAAAADHMLDAMGRSLPVFAQVQVRHKLGTAASQLVKQAGDALRGKVETLFTANAKALGQALKDAGAISDRQLDGADAAFAGVRALIARYDALFRKVLTATENAARAKLSIAMQIEEARVASQAVEIAGTFVSNGVGARAAFRALTRGDFAALIALIDSGGRDGFVLDPARSSLRRYAASTGKFGFEVVLIEFGGSVSELIESEASVLVDGSGNVQVDARGKLEKRFKGQDAEQEIALISSYALVRARALAAAPAAADRSMGLTVTVGHIDRKLERHEVDRFVASLADAGLVDASARQRAQEVYTRWTGNLANKGRLEATAQLRLALDRAAIGNLLAIASGPGGLSVAERRKIVRRAFDTLADSVPLHRQLIDRTIAFLAKANPKLSLEDLLMDEGRTRRELKVVVSGSHIRQVAPEHEPFDDAMRLAHGMLAMIERLRAIYFSTPEQRRDNDPASWSPQDYRDAQRSAVRAVREWLQLNAVLFWTNSKVHARTLAFLQTLASLAGVDPADRVSLTLWRNGRDDRPETVVLSHGPALG
ncbi:hypothetical protein [Blastomonas sp.]|uniref:hypothetical protein n=1 Tax=Blastomonas sp. TaxID=1909299 RepID=UPI00391A30A7